MSSQGLSDSLKLTCAQSGWTAKSVHSVCGHHTDGWQAPPFHRHRWLRVQGFAYTLNAKPLNPHVCFRIYRVLIKFKASEGLGLRGLGARRLSRSPSWWRGHPAFSLGFRAFGSLTTSLPFMQT